MSTDSHLLWTFWLRLSEFQQKKQDHGFLHFHETVTKQDRKKYFSRHYHNGLRLYLVGYFSNM